MQLKHLKTLIPSHNAPAKIMAVAWAPNNLKLAVCNYDRIILLYDEHGERRDKFPTKPADSKQTRESYVVKALAFSPDSTRLAVAQTDYMIYVYKLGEEWGAKKSIVNKFELDSIATSLIWLTEGPIIYGQIDGRIRAFFMKESRAKTLCAAESLIVALAPNSRGTGFICAQGNGTIARFYIAEDNMMDRQGTVTVHSVPPYALAWPSGYIFAGGCDHKVVVYEKDGKVHKLFDYTNEKDLTVAVCSPSGQAVAVAGYSRIHLYIWSQRRSSWEEIAPVEIKNLYTITSLAWKRDGSRVAVGGLCGSVELFQSVLRKILWKNKFELTYVGPSQVLVKPLNGEARGVILKSQFGHEIDDIRILGEDRYIVARTLETLLLGDLEKYLLSEVPWPDSGRREKFYFENPNVCLIFHAGELTLVEYGNNVILASVRTEYMNPHVISVRLNERRHPTTMEDNKKLAYLLDRKTISIIDLVYGIPTVQVSHNSKIDWLELNETSNKLLFRDKRMLLTLVDTRTGEKQPILNFCTFVQWIPGSDVVVAQSRNDACIWYNVDTPDRVTKLPVRGDIIDVLRQDGHTEILTQEGTHQLGYTLNEGLVEFGTAVHDSDFGRAIFFLEAIDEEGTSDTKAMWSNLADISMQLHNLKVAQRCFAALLDIPKVMYLGDTIRIGEEYVAEYGGDIMDCPDVWARLAILENDLKKAEAIYLSQNQLEKALDMYKDFHQWEEALQLAESSGFARTRALKEEYFQYLMKNNQLETAAQIMEEEGQLETAIDLFMQAALPATAARIVLGSSEFLSNTATVNKIMTALIKHELHHQAGQLFEATGDNDKALECYRVSHAYSSALRLARQVSPKDVVHLEEEWGDYLMTSKQLDAAINHYIEAGKTKKALECAVGGRQWKKAVQILQVVEDSESVSAYYSQLARHFVSTRDFQQAETLYIQGSMHKEAIQMYMTAEEWDRAYDLAQRYLSQDEFEEAFVQEGNRQEAQAKYENAERLYVLAGKADLAIAMFKALHQYEHMIRLVREHRPDLIGTTHIHLAQQMENEGDLAGAETHYLAAGEWKAAVKMLRSQNMWDQAYKVARQGGGEQAGQQVAFLWAKSLGGESAVKLLNRLDILESSIDYACDTYQFDFGFELAKLGMKSKLGDVHFKYAMTLEDDGKFQEAEEHFVKAGKPKEAVLMYVHSRDWDNAERVAETYDEDSLHHVLVAQAKYEFSVKNFQKFESLLLRAHKPELIIQQYKDNGQWIDALRVCKDYLPTKVHDLHVEYEKEVGSRGARDVSSLFTEAKQWELSGQYVTAVQCYLKVNSSNTRDNAVILKALSEAVRITNSFLDSEETSEVSRVLGGRLVDMKQYKTAAQLFLGLDMVKEAIDTFITAEDWVKARKVAKELEPGYEPYVDSKYKEALRSKGRADQLADVDIISALDLLCEQGHWKKAIDTAKTHGPNVLNKYLALYATHLIKSGSTEKALALYTEFEPPALPQNYNIYRRIALDILSVRRQKEDFKVLAQLRDMFFKLVMSMRTSPDNDSPVHSEFEDLMMIAHYYTIRHAAQKNPNLSNIMLKISIALLRYTDRIPADKAYYEAGVDAKSQGLLPDSFVFLNHCLDIAEALEDGEQGSIDHTDLMSTDFPQEIPLPLKPHLTPEEVEEIKEWILSVSVDQRNDMVLSTDERGVYPASLKSTSGAVAPACIVTGYPVLANKRRNNTVSFTKSGLLANKDDWNSLAMAFKLEESNPQLANIVAFFTNWAGNQPTISFT